MNTSPSPVVPTRLANGAEVQAFLPNNESERAGVVVAWANNEYVTWRVWQSSDGRWQATSGNYFPLGEQLGTGTTGFRDAMLDMVERSNYARPKEDA